jgi:hypothetical protein
LSSILNPEEPILFGKKLENIKLADPTWNSSEMPNSLDEWLINQDKIIDNVVDPQTSDELTDAWQISLQEAYNSEIKISKRSQLTSTTDIVGHIVNLTICLEGSLNRHLFYLRESQKLEISYYNLHSACLKSRMSIYVHNPR